MENLPSPLSFEWDAGNLDKNFRKHGVANREAEEAFFNEPKFTLEDNPHSQREKRYGLFGQTDQGKLLAIIFTLRNHRIRVISARSMSRKERRAYEEIKKNSAL